MTLMALGIELYNRTNELVAIAYIRSLPLDLSLTPNDKRVYFAFPIKGVYSAEPATHEFIKFGKKALFTRDGLKVGANANITNIVENARREVIDLENVDWLEFHSSEQNLRIERIYTSSLVGKVLTSENKGTVQHCGNKIIHVMNW